MPVRNAKVQNTLLFHSTALFMQSKCVITLIKSGPSPLQGEAMVVTGETGLCWAGSSLVIDKIFLCSLHQIDQIELEAGYIFYLLTF